MIAGKLINHGIELRYLCNLQINLVREVCWQQREKSKLLLPFGTARQERQNRFVYSVITQDNWLAMLPPIRPLERFETSTNVLG